MAVGSASQVGEAPETGGCLPVPALLPGESATLPALGRSLEAIHIPGGGGGASDASTGEERSWGQGALRGADLGWQAWSCAARASAHQGTAGWGLCALPIAEGGHIAPGLVPQAPLACGSGGLGPWPPPVLHSLLLQEPTHNLLFPALLLLLEGAAGNAVWAESQTHPRPERLGPLGSRGADEEAQGWPGQRPGAPTLGSCVPALLVPRLLGPS